MERQIENVVGYALGNGIYKLKQLALLLVSNCFGQDVTKCDAMVTRIISMITPQSSEIVDYLTSLSSLW